MRFLVLVLSLGLCRCRGRCSQGAWMRAGLCFGRLREPADKSGKSSLLGHRRLLWAEGQVEEDPWLR